MTKYLIAGLMAAVAVPALAQVAPPMPSMMMGHDKVMTRAEVQSHVGQMFARLDANRDGVVTKAEADAAHQGMGDKRGMKGDHRAMSAMHRDPTAAFDRLDANRDGMISRDEFTRAHAMRGTRGQGMVGNDMGHMKGGHGMGGMGMGGKMFDRADANHDGRLTQAEAQAQAFAHFDMMDTNRDGRITPDERQAAHQRMMQMHKSR